MLSKIFNRFSHLRIQCQAMNVSSGNYFPKLPLNYIGGERVEAEDLTNEIFEVEEPATGELVKNMSSVKLGTRSWVISAYKLTCKRIASGNFQNKRL